MLVLQFKDTSTKELQRHPKTIRKHKEEAYCSLATMNMSSVVNSCHPVPEYAQ